MGRPIPNSCKGLMSSSFVELGCAIPVSGGAQAYLAYAVSQAPKGRSHISADQRSLDRSCLICTPGALCRL